MTFQTKSTSGIQLHLRNCCQHIYAKIDPRCRYIQNHTDTSSVWRFPEIGVPPSHPPFSWDFSMDQTSYRRARGRPLGGACRARLRRRPSAEPGGDGAGGGPGRGPRDGAGLRDLAGETWDPGTLADLAMA